ncbi:MAG: MFS transporter [Gammaproteobacteria bacterium]|nr:MFS transporter [Gammaproteobacteria bacterium]
MGARRLLLGNPRFLLVWVVGGLTGIVRWLQLLALGLYTFQLTGSPLLVSVVPMLWMLPMALCGPFIGVAADRISRKALLLGALSLVLAVSAAMAAVSSAGPLEFPYVALASVLGGIFWASDMPVRRRLLGDLAGEDLAAAMSLDSATANSTRMAGPVLGGIMLQAFSLTGVFVLSTVVFAACLVAVVFIPVRGVARRVQSTYFVHELVSGIRFVARDSRLRWVFGITIVFNVWGFPFTSMIPVIGSARLGLDPAMVGLLGSIEGFGAFIGAIVIALTVRPRAFAPLYVWGTTAYLALIGCLGMVSFLARGPALSFLAAALVLLAIGHMGACFSAMQGTLSYLNALPEYRSRVLGVLTLCIGTGPIGFLHIGWLAETFGAPAALMITASEGLIALMVLRLAGSKYVAADAAPRHA